MPMPVSAIRSVFLPAREIVMLPDGYWYNEKNAISVAYPKYEENVMNYQKERNIGGAIHDLFSTAVLKKAQH